MAYTPIDKPSDYFNTALYTGNGTTNTTIAVGFQPDWVWLKKRSNADDHILSDAVRGAPKYLISNNLGAEATYAEGFKAFTSNGFTLGNANNTNQNGQTFVSWNWKAGTAVSGTTSGSGTGKAYSGSVNTDAGFSIIKYLGNGSAGHTIPHHLGAVVKMIILKRLDASSNWSTYHVGMGNGKSIPLNESEGATTSTSFWNDTTPTSSVFTVGSISNTNNNNSSIIAYSFADVKGYSKFGSYVGNGSTDGPFINLGFKPAYFMLKGVSSESWNITDDKRNVSNPSGYFLYANTTAAEYQAFTYSEMDFLSNGVKLRKSHEQMNTSGSEYVYMAFASNPFVTSTGIPGMAE